MTFEAGLCSECNDIIERLVAHYYGTTSVEEKKRLLDAQLAMVPPVQNDKEWWPGGWEGFFSRLLSPTKSGK